MPARKLKDFLDSQHIDYTSIPHSTAYTAQGIAALTHISGKEVAKTVMVKLDDNLSMAVLPASKTVDLEMLKRATGAKSAGLASEREFREKFPDCETGAMPPFGNLYNLPVLVEESLSRDKEIAFNAGTHNELIRMYYDDFARVVQPILMKFSSVKTAHAA
jgi:Ala-tRNA(Pro) deacylase